MQIDEDAANTCDATCEEDETVDSPDATSEGFLVGKSKGVKRWNRDHPLESG